MGKGLKKKACTKKKTLKSTSFRNPFLNFLREFRQRHKSLLQTEVVRQGAEKWRKLSQRTKNKYQEKHILKNLVKISHMSSDTSVSSGGSISSRGSAASVRSRSPIRIGRRTCPHREAHREAHRESHRPTTPATTHKTTCRRKRAGVGTNSEATSGATSSRQSVKSSNTRQDSTHH